MRNSKVALIICLLLVFHTTQVKAWIPWEYTWEHKELREYKDFFGFGPSVILFPYDKNLVSSFGLKVNIPIIPIRETYLHLDLGYYFVGGNLRSTKDGTFNYGIFSDKDGNWNIYDDGIRIRHRDCAFIPVSLNYDVFFYFDHYHYFFHFGPSIGTTILGIFDGYEYRANGKTGYIPLGQEPLPLPLKSETKAVFNYGANIGLKYISWRGEVIGLEYQFMYNHKTSFENETIKGGMHLISFVFSFTQ
ncbi:MAG: hypothetical protein FWD60_05950 [Candidatus Azobacteroides sp.]|nr:hypothetical protein [Candidatus Azobacteroides sp.]